ncbi:hypothetical protein [Burkholderia sp. B21-007]|uniref:hypothetical protein n=1 Tax=Burkholderia sp. B21-007 TaxID=2890407 RepID=UPI001E41F6A6|nr:hypothetical protein [Burkholderia sp. B21-007]UEP31572.1 hypothetical protein LMA01_20405 [Burkholderia sp. B21-007]
MTEPILTRDQILKIVRKTLKENNDRDKLSSESFMKLVGALEEAWQEKVCGERVAWVDEKSEVLVFGGWDKCPFAKSFKPVFYALTRSKP